MSGTTNDRVVIRVDPRPANAALIELMRAAWGEEAHGEFDAVLDRSLAHLCAYDGERLVGFVNVAWDGGIHATIFDTAVHPDYRRRGIGSALVRRAADVARERGAEWLHVDFAPHLAEFYRACGFRPTEAGLMKLG